MRLIERIGFGPQLIIERYQLDNGLRILIMPDHSSPVISYHTWFNVGSKHEVPGKTGQAHLLEHLMFGATHSYKHGDFDRILESVGANNNAATWTDWTYYYEDLPAAQLERVIELESDRLQHLRLHEDTIASEIEVVSNERRQCVDENVEGLASEHLYALALRSHPYKHPTIGWMDDIQGFSKQDCLDFYATYYAPNNACIVVVGNIDSTHCLSLLDKAYGSIPAARIPDFTPSPEPQQRKQRDKTLSYACASDKICMGYHSVALESREHITWSVLHECLFGGKSSVMWHALCADGTLASEARAFLPPFKDAALYEIWIDARPGVSSHTLLEHFDRTLQATIDKGFDTHTLEAACHRLELSMYSAMETASGKAEQIGFYETLASKPGYAFELITRYREQTPHDLQRLMTRYFKKSQRSIVHVTPK